LRGGKAGRGSKTHGTQKTAEHRCNSYCGFC
jgi:hypothetical protein